MNVQHNVPLADYTSLHVGGPAETLLIAQGNELRNAIIKADKPIWVFGTGTNCLISDKGLPGTVIINTGGEIEQIDQTTLRADAGVSWDEFVQKAISLNLYGLEFSSGIPGTTGAAVAGNIAAYGHKVADSLVSAELLDTESGQIIEWTNADFGFDYRSSNLQKPENKHLVVLTATFNFSTQPTSQLEYSSAMQVAKELGISADSLENRRKIIIEVRRRAGSLLTDNAIGPWTAGSFFKNPVVNQSQVETILSFEETGITKEQLLRQNQIHSGSTVRVSAAHVLLAAGFERGQTWGNVRLHPDHILKIENTGNATAQEIYQVIQHILETVQKKLGIDLEPEVRFLGEF